MATNRNQSWREKGDAEGVRIIMRYDNRRLYDTVQRTYIKHDDVLRLIRDRVKFRVINKPTNTDITEQTYTAMIITYLETGRLAIEAAQAIKMLEKVRADH